MITPQDIGQNKWPWGKWCILKEPGITPKTYYCVGGMQGVLVFRCPESDFALGYVTVVLGGDLMVEVLNERV